MQKYLDYDGLNYLWKKFENRVIESTNSLYEYVTITCSDNTGGVTTTFTITTNNVDQTFEYDKEPVIIKIPLNTTYTIKFGDVEGCATPESQTYTSVGGYELFFSSSDLYWTSTLSSIQGSTYGFFVCSNGTYSKFYNERATETYKSCAFTTIN